ncbi:hypothetical protein WJN01_12845 [Flavobacteriaceae bacterium SZ-1-7]|uniref:hypothetical protein n=1 Tax=Tamlana sedimenti TaxID=3134126 RepID=UPI00312A5570
MINPTNLSELVHSLKEKEIIYHRMKIAHLSKSIMEHPEEKSLSIFLKQSLERLEILLTA